MGSSCRVDTETVFCDWNPVETAGPSHTITTLRALRCREPWVEVTMGRYSRRSAAIPIAMLCLIAAVAVAPAAWADKLSAANYRPIDKRLSFPASSLLPAISPSSERQLQEDGYEPIGVVSVVRRLSHCKTVQECEWFEERADANTEARRIAARHGAELVTLWSDNREFVRTETPRGLARVSAPKDCERVPARPASGTVLTPGKTQYEVRCSFDSDFVRRTLYVESRGIAWRSSYSGRAGDNTQKAVELLDDLYRKDHNRSYRRAINFANEAHAGSSPSQTAPHPSRDDIEQTPSLPPLLHAAREGDAPAVAAMLDSGVPVTTTTAHGNTAVHFAAAGGHTPVVKLLIDRNAPWRQRNGNGAPALYLAARYGQLDTVLALLDAGANIDEQSLNFIDLTPAMVAAKYGHRALLDVLLERGADLGRKDNEGHDVLTHAVMAGDDTLVPPLLDRFDSEQRRQALKSGLYVAIVHNRPAAVAVLLEQGALTDYRYTTAIARDYTPLLLATEQRHPDIVEQLLAAGADPNVSTGVGNALASATRSHQHSKPEALETGAAIALQLLQAGAGHDQRVVGAVRMAKPGEQSGHERLVEYFLTEGVIGRGGLEQLYAKAVRAGRLDYVRRVVALAGEDTVPEDRIALLSAAIHSGEVAMVEHVLALGADVNAVLNRQQETALLLATKLMNRPIVAFLLQHGAEPQRTNSGGQTAASLAYAQNDLRMLKALSAVSKQANLGAQP